MLRTNMEAVLDRSVPRTDESFYIYLVRDGETVFYIGQSWDVYTRLEQHLGMDWRNDASHLGKCVIDNHPQSEAWEIEFYSLRDCEAMVMDFMKAQGDTTYTVERYYAHTQSAIDTAEEAMIKFHRPCLNVAANPHPTLLPERYNHDIPVNPFGKAMGKMLGFGDN